MTAAEAEQIKAALLVESSHLRRKGPSTHCLTCDCQFLRALDAVIDGEARTERVFASAVKSILSMEAD